MRKSFFTSILFLFSPCLTFSFFRCCRLFTLINVIVTTRNACAFTITKPWEFIRAITACFHIACISYVAWFVCQSALVTVIAWSLRLSWWLATVPRIKCIEFFCSFWICYPLEGLSCCNKPNIGSINKKKMLKLLIFYYKNHSLQWASPIKEFM